MPRLDARGRLWTQGLKGRDEARAMARVRPWHPIGGRAGLARGYEVVDTVAGVVAQREAKGAGTVGPVAFDALAQARREAEGVAGDLNAGGVRRERRLRVAQGRRCGA